MRLQGSKDSTIQKKALEVLLSGEGVPLKAYPPNNWAPPTDTPAKLGAAPTKYDGPYPIEVSLWKEKLHRPVSLAPYNQHPTPPPHTLPSR